MSRSWWRNLVESKSVRVRQAARRPWLEYLESRLAPATHTWNGAGIANNWALDSNWTGGSPAGDGAALGLRVQRPTFGGRTRRSTTRPFFRCDSTISSMSCVST